MLLWRLVDKMGELKYVIGDATTPIGEGPKIIVHCCNDIGGWGSGFVVALSKKWHMPETNYRIWAQDSYYKKTDGSKVPFKLGNIQYVQVESDTYVCNMIGQSNIGWSGDRPPIRYGSIAKCLEQVAEDAKYFGATVHGPRFGSALAGGDWNVIETLIKAIILPLGVDVTIYDLPTAEDLSQKIQERMDMNLF